MRYLFFIFLLFTPVLCIAPLAQAQVGVYQTLDSFLETSFTAPPSSETLWLNDDIRAQLGDALDRNYRGLRIRYWRLGDRTAWVLNEIGKERPITSGITIEEGKIVSISVLEYRESRGGEVKLASFRRQFVNVGLTKKNKLDKRIQGITGATMSVRTLSRSSVAAIKLHGFALQATASQSLSNN